MTLGIAFLLCLPLAAQTFAPTGNKDADQYLSRLAAEGCAVRSACLSFDEQTLYMSAVMAPKQDADIFIVVKVKGEWGRPQLQTVLSTERDELTPTVSPNGGVIYFVREVPENPNAKKVKMQSYIYFAELQPDGSWQAPQVLAISNGTDSEPKILPDNQTLLLTSVRDEEKKAQAKRYYIRKMGKYNWTLPIEVGETSEKNLCLPYMTLKGTVSDRQSRQPMTARVDVYDALTKRLVSAHQTAADGSFVLALSQGGLYKVDVWQEGYSHDNLVVDCTGEFLPLKGWRPSLSNQLQIKVYTYDGETMQPLSPKVEVLDGETDKPLAISIERSKKARENAIIVRLPIGKDYVLHLENEAYADTSVHVDTRKEVLMTESELDMLMRIGRVRTTVVVTDAETGEAIDGTLNLAVVGDDEAGDSVAVQAGRWQGQMRCATAYHLKMTSPGYFFADTMVTMPGREEPVVVKMTQKPLKQAQVLQLKNVQFEYGSYLLREDSYEELRFVADLMRQNPTIRVEISAHTDDRGSDAFNKRLSQLRGEEVTRYLIDNEGIAPERIHAVGYGKDRPLVPNDSDENRALNRRVEFEILEL